MVEQLRQKKKNLTFILRWREGKATAAKREGKATLVAELECAKAKPMLYKVEEDDQWVERKKLFQELEFYELLGACSTFLFEHKFEG